MVRVGGQTRAAEAGVHARAARQGMRLGLEHQHAGTLSQDEPVTALVVRARGGLRLVVPGRQCAHLREAGHRQRVHAGLGAPCDDHVRAAAPQQVEGQRDRLGPGGAGTHGGVHSGTGAEGEADRRGRPVRHEHRDQVRRDRPWSLVPQYLGLAEQRQGTADAGPDDHGEPLGRDGRRAGVRPGLARGDERELLDAVERAGLDPFEPALEVHRGGETGRQRVPLLALEQAHAGATGEQAFGERGHVGTEGGEGAEPCDGDRAREGSGHAGTRAAAM